MTDPKEIIKFWYEQIGFPANYDETFRCTLESHEIDPQIKKLVLEGKVFHGSYGVIRR